MCDITEAFCQTSASSGTHVEGNHGETHCSTSVIGTLHHEFGRGKAGQTGGVFVVLKVGHAAKDTNTGPSM